MSPALAGRFFSTIPPGKSQASQILFPFCDVHRNWENPWSYLNQDKKKNIIRHNIISSSRELLFNPWTEKLAFHTFFTCNPAGETLSYDIWTNRSLRTQPRIFQFYIKDRSKSSLCFGPGFPCGSWSVLLAVAATADFITGTSAVQAHSVFWIRPGTLPWPGFLRASTSVIVLSLHSTPPPFSRCSCINTCQILAIIAL